MEKKKDFYWTITKKEYLERLYVLDIYSRDIWNYLQAYIIRGQTDIPLWKACYDLYEIAGLLASSISIKRICKDLKISRMTVIRRLEELDSKNHIVRYTSRRMNEEKESINNTNIYIIGIKNFGYDEGNITREENYFVNRTKEMSDVDRAKIIRLFTRQLETENMIKETTKELQAINKKLFSAVTVSDQSPVTVSD